MLSTHQAAAQLLPKAVPAASLLGFSLFALVAQRILQSLTPSPD
jgi:hypothetical protein